jgi:hypothetical protein
MSGAIGATWQWFRDHAHAVLITLAWVQNSHLLGAKASALMQVVTNVVSALSGT